MEYVNVDVLYETSDLPLVATLVCFGARIEGVEKNGGPRVTFYLRHEGGLDELVNAYYARELKVEPLAYFQALRDAKSRLYGPPIE